MTWRPITADLKLRLMPAKLRRNSCSDWRTSSTSWPSAAWAPRRRCSAPTVPSSACQYRAGTRPAALRLRLRSAPVCRLARNRLVHGRAGGTPLRLPPVTTLKLQPDLELTFRDNLLKRPTLVSCHALHH